MGSVMERLRSQLLSTLTGLLIAGLFLYFTFRKADIGAMWAQVSGAGLWATTGMLLLALATLLLRGVRWWYLLPRPLQKGELLAAQRALALGYGVNNVASRIGEIVRIHCLKRDTKRDLAGVTGTVVAARLHFDLLTVGFLFAFVLASYRARVIEAFPQVERAFLVFLVVLFGGSLALFLLAIRPQLVKRLLALSGLSRIPAIWQRVETLIAQMSAGLGVLASPGPFLLVSGINLACWLLGILYFRCALAIFGIETGGSEILFLFTVSSLGLLLPSPGGVGTVHYFMTLALTHFLAVDPLTAAATATYAHGVNFLLLSLAALVFLFVKPRVLDHSASILEGSSPQGVDHVSTRP